MVNVSLLYPYVCYRCLNMKAFLDPVKYVLFKNDLLKLRLL